MAEKQHLTSLCQVCDAPLDPFNLEQRTCLECLAKVWNGEAEIERGEVVEYEV